MHDRNGTTATLDAFSILNRNDIELVIKCFNKEAVSQWGIYKRNNITIDSNNTLNYEHNYMGFDAMILPRKYGGLCLPMQEALSFGMPVIMTDVSPNDKVLPKEWLIPTVKKFTFESRNTIEVNEPDINALSHKINWLADMNEDDASSNSKIADRIAKNLDWNIWKKKYMDLLNS